LAVAEGQAVVVLVLGNIAATFLAIVISVVVISAGIIILQTTTRNIIKLSVI
jgi:hypothetical protein